MKLFFSFSLILVISIIDFFCVSHQRWFLLVVSLTILIFFGFTIYKEIRFWKIGALILLFLLIFISFWFQHRPYHHKNFTVYEETSTYTIKEKFKNSLIISNSQNERIYVQNYFLKKNIGEKRINLEDRFKAKVFVQEKISLQNNEFDLFLASKKTYLKGKLLDLNKSTLKQNKNVRNRLINYFNQQKYKQNKDWILFLIFQSSSVNFTTIKNKIYNLGIAHLFVVSGFHLTIIGAIWFYFSAKCKKKWAKYSLIIIGLFFCGFLTYLTNWKISALKSFIFLIFNLVFIRLTKFKIKIEKTELTAFLGFVFLIFNPLIFYQLEFQLSFLAGWSLNFISQNLQKNKKREIWKIFKTNLFIWIVLFPVVINLTFRFNLMSPILIFLYGCWALIFYPIFFSAIWIPFLNPFFHLLFQSIQWSLSFFDQMVFYIPFGEMKSIYIFLHYFFLLFFIFLAKWYGSPSKNFFPSFLIIFIIFLFNWFGMNFYHFHIIDVGHGLAMFLQSPDKSTNILFDAGSGWMRENNTKKISNFLKKYNVMELDAVFISHNHTDHFNNLKHLNKNFVIKKIYNNVNQKQFYKVNDMIFTNLAFNFSDSMLNENNRSLILQFEIQNHAFLLTFDAEKEAEYALLKERKVKKIKFLQVGHHGSKTSSTKEFLKTISPEYCLVSSNKKLELYEKFKKVNCEVYNTHIMGSINILLKKPFQIKIEKKLNKSWN